MSRKIICFPWIGEFGWEVFSWAPLLRSIKKSDPNITDMICFTRPGREVFYKDFATVNNFTPCPCTPDMYHCFTDDIETLNKEIHHTVSPYLKEGYEPIVPADYSQLVPNGNFIKFGLPSSDLHYDVLIHARNRPHRPHDNWSQHKWEKLIQMNDWKVAAIGDPEQTFSINGVDDHRGIPVENLVDIMASSSVIIGPSSGPLHLATLCECPQVVWSDSEGTLSRYKGSWNPFNIHVKTLLNNDPNPEEVYDLYKEIKTPHFTTS